MLRGSGYFSRIYEWRNLLTVGSRKKSSSGRPRAFANREQTPRRRPALPCMECVLLLEKLNGSIRRSSRSTLSLHGDRDGLGLTRRPRHLLRMEHLLHRVPGAQGHPKIAQSYRRRLTSIASLSAFKAPYQLRAGTLLIGSPPFSFRPAPCPSTHVNSRLILPVFLPARADHDNWS